MNDPTTGRSSTLTVLPDGHRIIVRPGETVLQALYAAGLAYRTGCRRVAAPSARWTSAKAR